ncbi:MAG: hypothetical protein ACLT5H_08550 [Collinsella stercoris]|uniref:hypothetical protein n=1 Tax=Collinsella stercoris TaxID=147206 RepID=UPI00399218E2
MATPTVRTVNAQNQNHLVAASNEAGWRRYLETLSRHTGCANAFYNLSAMNCAGLAASDWHESREILPIATWKSLFPGADIKPADGCTGVYCVKSRPRGSGGGLFYVDELFPPALLVGLPPTMLRGAARVLDLSVDIAAASWSDAEAGLYRIVNVADMDSDTDAAPEAERVPVAWVDLDQNTRFVIEAHFRAQGPGCASPVLPPDDVKGKASSLKMYVNEIVKTAAPSSSRCATATARPSRGTAATSSPKAAQIGITASMPPSAAPGRRRGRAGTPPRRRRRPARTGGSQGRPRRPGRLCGQPRAGAHREGHEGDRQTLQGGWRSGGYGDRGLPSSETAGDAGAIGRHFARKGETVDSPVAGDQVGSRKGTDVETVSRPEAPPVPLRAAGTDDGGPDVKSGREAVGDTGGTVPAREGGRLAESRTEAHDRRRERLGRHGRPSERGADDGGEVDTMRPHGRRYRRMDGEDVDGNGPERHAMRRRRGVEAKPAPEAPPEKYYPHGRPPRETAGHAKSAAARTAKDRGKKKKPPTGKGSS